LWLDIRNDQPGTFSRERLGKRASHSTGSSRDQDQTLIKALRH
jgi:hypothetical protein